MKRKTIAFLECAKNSLILAVEIFNRPSDAGRQEAVLLFLDHAFEMLLKAVVFEKTARIRDRREKFNYGFEKCLNIAQSQLNLVDKDEALILMNLNGFRDAAAHDLVDISEGLLYGHAQSAVTIFAALLKKVFNIDLGKTLPRRILPIATVAPTDIHAIVAEDMTAIMGMLGGKKRQEDEAEARLRPYQVIEENIRSAQGVPGKAPSASRILRELKKADWRSVLPLVAGLVQPLATGIPISIHSTKRNGFPVRIDPKAPTAIAFRYVKPEDKWPYLTGELAKKLGISMPRLVAYVKLFKMKGNEDYHTGLKVSQTGTVHRYSEKARQVIAEAIRHRGADLLWTNYKAGMHMEPRDYLVTAQSEEPRLAGVPDQGQKS